MYTGAQMNKQQYDQYNMQIPRKQKVPLFYKMVFPSLAAFLTIFMLFNLLSKPRTFSSQENRNLAQMPELSLESLADGSYFSALSAYQSDQFIGRDYWIRLRNSTQKFFGFKENDGIYFGSDGYLLKQGEPLDETKLNATLKAVDDFSNANPDMRITFLLVPGAQTVLSDKLPSGISAEDAFPDRSKAIELTQSVLGNGNNPYFTYVNVENFLKQAENTDRLYYKTDHHWTTYGAYTAFTNVKTAMAIDEPTPSFEVLPVSESFQGTLASQSGSFEEEDTIVVFRPIASEIMPEVDYYVLYPDEKIKLSSCYRMEKLAEKDQYTLFFGGNYGRLEIHTTNFNDRKLLIFKDSYANCFIPFLIPYFQEIEIIDPRYYYEDLDLLIRNEQITDVLFLYSENTFFEDVTLKDVLAG